MYKKCQINSEFKSFKNGYWENNYYLLFVSLCHLFLYKNTTEQKYLLTLSYNYVFGSFAACKV